MVFRMRKYLLINIFYVDFDIESRVSESVLYALLDRNLLCVVIIFESVDILVLIGKVCVDVPFTGLEAFETLILAKSVL